MSELSLDQDTEEAREKARRSKITWVGNRKLAIPQDVLRQFDAAVQWIRPEVYLPIALLLRCTGWRIRDLLDLRIDSCLERDQYGWWVCSHMPRRRVPITEAAAQALEEQRVHASEGALGEVNKSRYVFVIGRGHAKGNPITKTQVNRALQQLAADHCIMGTDGEIYLLATGAFQRTKYLEMIQAGINLSSIQAWMNDDSIYEALTCVQNNL